MPDPPGQHDVQQQLPEVNPQQGGAQRWRVHIPTPRTDFVLGLRGTPALGADGVAFYTERNFVTEIGMNTVLQSAGHTTVTSNDRSTFLSHANASISTNANFLLGTVGDVSITAGHAGFSYRGCLVRDGDDVPDPPAIDVVSPRHLGEHDYATISRLSSVWSVLSAVRTWIKYVPKAPVQSGWPLASAAHNLATAAVSAGEVALAGASAAAEALDVADHGDSGAAGIRIHAAGDLKATSSKATIFGRWGVSVASLWKVSMKALYKVEMKTSGVAKVWGAAAAALKSEVLATVSGKFLSLSGDLTHLLGKKNLVVASDKLVSIRSDGVVELRAKTATLSASDGFFVSGKATSVGADTTVTVKGDQRAMMTAPEILVEARRQVRLRQGRATVTLEDDKFTLHCVTAAPIVASSNEVELLGGHKFKRGEVVLRGNQVRLG